jgi:uncharacterized membrane protein
MGFGKGAGIGASIGASVGSIFPGPGTAIGAALGALVGGIANAGSDKRKAKLASKSAYFDRVENSKISKRGLALTKAINNNMT